MKKIIAAIAAVSLVACLLAGCALGGSKKEVAKELHQVQLSRGSHITFDANTVNQNGYEITAKDGSWRMTIHECYSSEELESYQEFFEKNVEMNAGNNIVTEKKQLGEYSYDTATYTANEQNFGEYFTAFPSPVACGEDTKLYGYSISTWMKQNDGATRDAVETVIGTLTAG